jgi:hypothetical protein
LEVLRQKKAAMDMNVMEADEQIEEVLQILDDRGILEVSQDDECYYRLPPSLSWCSSRDDGLCSRSSSLEATDDSQLTASDDNQLSVRQRILADLALNGYNVLGSSSGYEADRMA